MLTDSAILRSLLEADARDAHLPRILEAWDPVDRPVHCSNCRHCKVGGTERAPLVFCAKGHDNGRAQDIWRMIRVSRPLGFRPAPKCPDFTSMDDDG